MTLSPGVFRQVGAFPPAPIATGWSDPCREGLAPSQELCLSTAHDCFVASAPRKDDERPRDRRGGFAPTPPRHCEPTGRANARPMINSAKQSSDTRADWIASSQE